MVSRGWSDRGAGVSGGAGMDDRGSAILAGPDDVGGGLGAGSDEGVDAALLRGAVGVVPAVLIEGGGDEADAFAAAGAEAGVAAHPLGIDRAGVLAVLVGVAARLDGGVGAGARCEGAGQIRVGVDITGVVGV